MTNPLTTLKAGIGSLSRRCVGQGEKTAESVRSRDAARVKRGSEEPEERKGPRRTEPPHTLERCHVVHLEVDVAIPECPAMWKGEERHHQLPH